MRHCNIVLGPAQSRIWPLVAPVVLLVIVAGTGSWSDAAADVDDFGARVVIESVIQPNPHFILPGDTLTFEGGFIVRGCFDSHTYFWDFDDGSSEKGVPDEQDECPFAIGSTVVRHAYSSKGTYFISLTISDVEGNYETSRSWPLRVESPGAAVHDLEDYVEELPDDAFQGSAVERRKSLRAALDAVVSLISDGEHDQAVTALRRNALSRADGSLEGDSTDDWIRDPAAQQQVSAMIGRIVAYLGSL
jgi:hypothetical protein